MKTIATRSRSLPGPALRLGTALVALALLAAPLAAQRHAQPRSGSSGSGSGSPSARHSPSGGSGGSSSRGSSGSSAHRPGSDRSPHRPTGSRYYGGDHHYHGGSRYYFYPSFGFSFGYYDPFYYYPYYYGWRAPYYGYYGGYYRPWGYPPPAYPPGGSYERGALGAVDLKVKPKAAEVYVDGRFLGTAGSFDGFPGYLWLDPGPHSLALAHEGYATFEREIEVTPGQVLEFDLKLQPGVATRPEPLSYEDYGRYQPPGGEGGGPMPAPPPEQARMVGTEGEISFAVQPGDASVYVDGRFVGTGEQVSRAPEPLTLGEGEHVIEVVHPSFETQERRITVRGGESRTVQIELEPRGGR